MPTCVISCFPAFREQNYEFLIASLKDKLVKSGTEVYTKSNNCFMYELTPSQKGLGVGGGQDENCSYSVLPPTSKSALGSPNYLMQKKSILKLRTRNS